MAARWPAGQRAAIQGAKCGRRVAVIEQREIVGGACVNTGTIPSKTMREAVMHLSGFQYQGIYGINYRVKEKITMADLGFRVNQVIKTEVDVTQAQLTRNGVEVITGRTIVNSDQILDIPEIPKTLIVVGGGVIGVEYTCMFAILGSRVILVEKRPRLLEFADAEMVEALSYNLRDHRVTMRLKEEVAAVEDKGKDVVVARMKSNKIISGDVLLYAAGRQGNVDDLNLAAAGLEADSRGRIVVDAEYRTKAPNIFAAGDIIGFPSLASVSMEQGRLAAANAVGLKIPSNPATYPYGIHTIPEISFTGQTEEQLTDADVPYEVGVAYYRDTARGQIRGDTSGRLKLIFHRETRQVLGVHIIGEGATELLHIGQAVMILKGTIDYFVETVFNYPTLAECYKVAAFNGINKLMRF